MPFLQNRGHLIESEEKMEVQDVRKRGAQLPLEDSEEPKPRKFIKPDY